MDEVQESQKTEDNTNPQMQEAPANTCTCAETKAVETLSFTDKVAGKIEHFGKWFWSYFKRHWIIFALAIPLTIYLLSDIMLMSSLSLWVDFILIATVLSGLIFYAFTKYQPKFIYGEDGKLDTEELKTALNFAVNIFKTVAYTGAIIICAHYFNLLSK